MFIGLTLSEFFKKILPKHRNSLSYYLNVVLIRCPSDSLSLKIYHLFNEYLSEHWPQLFQILLKHNYQMYLTVTSYVIGTRFLRTSCYVKVGVPTIVPLLYIGIYISLKTQFSLASLRPKKLFLIQGGHMVLRFFIVHWTHLPSFH